MLDSSPFQAADNAPRRFSDDNSAFQASCFHRFTSLVVHLIGRDVAVVAVSRVGELIENTLCLNGAIAILIRQALRLSFHPNYLSLKRRGKVTLL